MNKRVFTNLHKVSGTEHVKYNSTKPPESLVEKSGTEALRYQQNIPSYFRMMDDPKYRNIVHKEVDGSPATMMQVVSKNQGWITVNAEKPDRKRPIEKSKLGEASKVNALSPNWMQV